MKKAISDNVIYSSGNYKRAGRANRAEKKVAKIELQQKTRISLKTQKKGQAMLNDDERIIKNINFEQIGTFRNFNQKAYSNTEITRQDKLKLLNNLLDMVSKSSYVDELTKMARNNISQNWFDRPLDKEFVSEILMNEKNTIPSLSDAQLSVRVCYWANRVAHRIEKEAKGDGKNHLLNEVYVQRFLDKKYNYDLKSVTEKVRGKRDNEIDRSDRGIKGLTYTLKEKREELGSIDTLEKLNDLFLGYNVRNELWAVKRNMIREVIRDVARDKDCGIRVAIIEEDNQHVSVSGRESVRFGIFENNAITPIIMHCDKEELENHLNKYISPEDMSRATMKTNDELIQFARKGGKTGIYWKLSNYEQEILELEGASNPNAARLHKILRETQEYDYNQKLGVEIEEVKNTRDTNNEETIEVTIDEIETQAPNLDEDGVTI